MFRLLLKILLRLAALMLIVCVVAIFITRAQKPHDWLAYVRAAQRGELYLYLMDTAHPLKPSFPLSQNWITTGDHDWSVDGRLAFNVGGWVEASEILIFDPYTMTLIDPIMDRQGREFEPDWSADGRQLTYSGVYDGATNRNVYLVNPANGQIQQVTTNGEMPAWSPDGRLAYVLRNQGGDTDIAIYDLETDTQTGLAERHESAEYPHWSPDGWLAFRQAARDGGSDSLWIYDGFTEIFVDVISSQQMSWSDNGKLVYSSPFLPPDTDIHMYDTATQTITNMTQQTPLAESSPSWTPSGDLIFIAEVGNQYDIYYLDLETGTITNLTNSPQSEYYTAWMP